MSVTDRVSATATVDLGIGNFGSTSEFSQNIIANAPNVAPTITFGEGDKTFTENTAPILIDALITIADPDSANFSGGQLIVNVPTNGNAYDSITIRNQGMGAGQIGVSGTNVFYGGVLIGTFTGSGAPFQTTFNASAELTAVQSLAQNIQFSNSSAAPSTLPRTVQFVLTDGDGGTSAAITKTINLIAVNDAPVITSNGGNVNAFISVLENTTAVTTVTATDPDSSILTYSINGGTDASRFAINAATGELKFIIAPNFELPTDSDLNGVYDVNVQVSDGSLNDTQAISVTVTNVNEAPTFSIGTGTNTTNIIGNSALLSGFPSSYVVSGTPTTTRYIGINCDLPAPLAHLVPAAGLVVPFLRRAAGDRVQPEVRQDLVLEAPRRRSLVIDEHRRAIRHGRRYPAVKHVGRLDHVIVH